MIHEYSLLGLLLGYFPDHRLMGFVDRFPPNGIAYHNFGDPVCVLRWTFYHVNDRERRNFNIHWPLLIENVTYTITVAAPPYKSKTDFMRDFCEDWEEWSHLVKTFHQAYMEFELSCLRPQKMTYLAAITRALAKLGVEENDLRCWRPPQKNVSRAACRQRL